MKEIDITTVKVKRMRPEQMEYTAEQIAYHLGWDEDICHPSSEYGMGIRIYREYGVVEEILADIVPLCEGNAMIAIAEIAKSDSRIREMVRNHMAEMGAVPNM